MQDAPTHTVLLVTGPTGSGKSQLALSLAAAHGGEIVNADTVQLYRGFDIGSAKPTPDEQVHTPHHLYSVADASAPLDAEDFRALADPVLAEISSRGALPILVGGPSLYLTALLSGLVETPPVTPAAEALLAAREEALRAESADRRAVAHDLHRWLAELDPEKAESLEPADLSRIRRALLVVLSCGVPLSELQRRHAKGAARYRALAVLLLPERRALYERLDARVDEMLEAGLVEEVAGLLAQHGPECRVLTSIGYRQIAAQLRGEFSVEESIRQLKRDTRRFAKRQLSWLRTQPTVFGWQEHPQSPICCASMADTRQLIEKISYSLAGVISDFAALPPEQAERGVAFLRVENVDMNGPE